LKEKTTEHEVLDFPKAGPERTLTLSDGALQYLALVLFHERTMVSAAHVEFHAELKAKVRPFVKVTTQ